MLQFGGLHGKAPLIVTIVVLVHLAVLVPVDSLAVDIGEGAILEVRAVRLTVLVLIVVYVLGGTEHAGELVQVVTSRQSSPVLVPMAVVLLAKIIVHVVVV